MNNSFVTRPLNASQINQLTLAEAQALLLVKEAEATFLSDTQAADIAAMTATRTASTTEKTAEVAAIEAKIAALEA